MVRIFEWLTPNNMLDLGARLLLLAFAMQLLVPKYSKVAIWFAVIGGFGVGGSAGGWVGEMLADSTTAATSFMERWTNQMVGSGFGFLVFAILFFFVWKFGGRGASGLEAKGKSKVAKVKQIGWLLAFAMAGTAIAGLPEIYGLVDSGVSSFNSAVSAALPS
jgi:hypothetical protein